jgi:hypothetical protein
VGCRTRADKRLLLRLVRSAAGDVVVDVSGCGPGRGAYVHPDLGCVDQAIRRGAIARALRTGLDADGAARLRRSIEEELPG